MAIKDMSLRRATAFLENVLDQKESVPFRRFTGGKGRHRQSKNWKYHSSSWPKKSAEFVLQLLHNAEANAEVKGLNVEALRVTHIQVQQAQKQRRRTYRAHGRINPYMCSPCHIELLLEEREKAVRKGTEPTVAPKRANRLRLAPTPQ